MRKSFLLLLVLSVMNICFSAQASNYVLDHNNMPWGKNVIRVLYEMFPSFSTKDYSCDEAEIKIPDEPVGLNIACRVDAQGNECAQHKFGTYFTTVVKPNALVDCFGNPIKSITIESIPKLDTSGVILYRYDNSTVFGVTYSLDIDITDSTYAQICSQYSKLLGNPIRTKHSDTLNGEFSYYVTDSDYVDICISDVVGKDISVEFTDLGLCNLIQELSMKDPVETFDPEIYANEVHSGFDWAISNSKYKTGVYYDYGLSKVAKKNTSYIFHIGFNLNEDHTQYQDSVAVRFFPNAKCFTIALDSKHGNNRIKQLMNIAFMAIMHCTVDSADDCITWLCDSYDGNRSELLSSDEYCVYLRKDMLNINSNGYELVVLDTKYRQLPITKLLRNSFREMDYKALTSPLNQGEWGTFVGTVKGVNYSSYLDQITVKLEDGNSYIIYHNIEDCPVRLVLDKKYRFYGSISSTYDLVGKFIVMDIIEE